MSLSPRFLSVDEVLRVHQRTIELHGGSSELRDRGLLESAVAMPAAQFGGSFLHEGLSRMAAAYLFHLCKNHPFVDGNKRVALAAAELFLSLNGHSIDANNDEVVDLTLNVADGSLSKEALTAWMSSRVTTVT
jgi:death-on-curing protein